MTIAELHASVEGNSLESEIARTIPKLPRTGAAFRRTESGDGEPSAENLGNSAAPSVKSLDGRN